MGTTKTAYVIRLENPETAAKTKTHLGWSQTLGNATKLVRPRFEVVAHQYPAAGMDLEENKQQAIDQIMEENDFEAKGFRIDDLRWLKPEDKMLGVLASLGTWIGGAETAKWTEMNGLVRDQRYIGSVEAYRVDKKRCCRCQKMGHLAWSCKEKTWCKHCGDEHDLRECLPGSNAKCTDCNGLHATGSQGCSGPIIPRTRS